MNICRKFLSAAGLLGLLCLLLPSPARADTVYTYTSATLSDATTFTITLHFSTPLPNSLVLYDETSTVASWSAVDTGDGIDLGSSSSNYLGDLILSTDASGAIVPDWDFLAFTSSSDTLTSIQSTGMAIGPSYFDLAINDSDPYTPRQGSSDSPGVWTSATTPDSVSTPEPGTFSLLFVGLLGLGLLAGVKRYRENRLQTQG